MPPFLKLSTWGLSPHRRLTTRFPSARFLVTTPTFKSANHTAATSHVGVEHADFQPLSTNTATRSSRPPRVVPATQPQHLFKLRPTGHFQPYQAPSYTRLPTTRFHPAPPTLQVSQTSSPAAASVTTNKLLSSSRTTASQPDFQVHAFS